jgi:ATP adenylyltransferase
MDLIWSPWRYTYVSSAAESDSCVFCIGSPQGDETRLVLYRGEFNFVIMNLYPYTSGHLMVAPYAHVPSITGTEPEHLGELFALARRSVEVLETVYRPEGFNLGMNLGACAGAGVRGHIHLHVVPRWCGDVNFMTSTGETRVLPEDLPTTFRKLLPLFG